MKICFPVTEDNGLESTVYDHFGSAPLYLILDTETGQVKSVENPNCSHDAGHCNPTAALSGTDVHAVVVGGIGPGALSKLLAMHLTIYRAVPGNIRENAAHVAAGTLPAFTGISACTSAGNGGGCGTH